MQAHHIIPKQLANGAADPPLDVLQRVGFDLDNAANGVLLPKTIHDSNHPFYTDAMKEALERIPDNISIEKQMEMVYELQATAVRAFSESGASLTGPNKTTLAEWRKFLL